MHSSRNISRFSENETTGLSSISKQTKNLKTNIAQTNSDINHIVYQLVIYANSENLRNTSKSHLHRLRSSDSSN